jgi:mannose-1-phosphate guanylyltransferase
MYFVIMAGGVGTRFWPRSRASYPKQMLSLFGERSMLQNTYDRISGLTTDEKILVITNSELKDSVHEQLPELPSENIIAEPFGRNTAPCIALAGAIIQRREKKDQVMVVLPADHLIQDIDNFKECIQAAAKFAPEEKCLITVGIKPTYPETGYGYIQKDSPVSSQDDRPVYKVKTFAEKPDHEIATQFLNSGDFLWNSGMFIWTVQTIMDELDEHQPEISEGAQKIREHVDSSMMDDVIFDIYSRIKSVSIDYGVMEVAQKVCVIEADFGWNDVGSWEAVYNIAEKDQDANAVDCTNKILINSSDNYIYSKKKLVAAIDVEGLVVVDTDDALLICRKDQSQKVKDLVDQIRRKDLEDFL